MSFVDQDLYSRWGAAHYALAMLRSPAAPDLEEAKLVFAQELLAEGLGATAANVDEAINAATAEIERIGGDPCWPCVNAPCEWTETAFVADPTTFSSRAASTQYPAGHAFAFSASEADWVIKLAAPHFVDPERRFADPTPYRPPIARDIAEVDDLEHFDAELSRRCREILIAANTAWFGFDIDVVTAKVVEYHPGHAWPSHADYSPERPHGKLAMTVQLSRSDEYEGGTLLLHHHAGRIVRASRELGAAIVYPTMTMHEVEPVTSGVRHALIVFGQGPPVR